MAVIQKNPSTATRKVYDNTVYHVLALAKKEGFSSVVFLNLSPHRAKNPNELEGKTEKEQIADENNNWIKKA